MIYFFKWWKVSSSLCCLFQTESSIIPAGISDVSLVCTGLCWQGLNWPKTVLCPHLAGENGKGGCLGVFWGILATGASRRPGAYIPMGNLKTGGRDQMFTSWTGVIFFFKVPSKNQQRGHGLQACWKCRISAQPPNPHLNQNLHCHTTGRWLLLARTVQRPEAQPPGSIPRQGSRTRRALTVERRQK